MDFDGNCDFFLMFVIAFYILYHAVDRYNIYISTDLITLVDGNLSTGLDYSSSWIQIVGGVLAFSTRAKMKTGTKTQKFSKERLCKVYMEMLSVLPSRARLS